MRGPRYKVATVSGYASDTKRPTHQGPGLTAHVLDTLDCHRVVASFRSEDPVRRKHWRDRPGPGRRIGREGATAAATALADEWNADEGYTNRRAPAKVPPDDPTTRDRRGRV